MIPLRDSLGRVLNVSEQSVDAWVARGYRRIEEPKPAAASTEDAAEPAPAKKAPAKKAVAKKTRKK